MIPQKNNPGEAIAAFKERFSEHIGTISRVFRSISYIDTGHDGAEICLHEAKQRVVGNWEMSAMPNLDYGHDGGWDVNISQIYSSGVGDDDPILWVKQWTRLEVKYNSFGKLISCTERE